MLRVAFERRQLSTSNPQRPTVNSEHANYHHRLFGRGFVVVFLVRTDLGGTKDALQRARRISMEDRADGSSWALPIRREYRRQ